MTLKDFTHGLYDEIDKACDLSLYWNHPDFHCFRQFSPETRMWFAMNAVEAEISNGGLPQLLWNTHAHWRDLLVDALFGYSSIGAHQYSHAISEVMCFFTVLEQKLPNAPENTTISSGPLDGLVIHPLGQWGESVKSETPEKIEELFYKVQTIDPLKCAVLERTFHERINEIRLNADDGNG